MNTYFFVPATNQKFIDNVTSLKSDYFVYDLEDSVGEHEIKIGLYNLSKIKLNNWVYVRPRLFSDINAEILNEDLLISLIEIGFRNFLIPKYRHIVQIQKIIGCIEKFDKSDLFFKFILAVESPLGLLNVREAIESKLINIVALALGSHDYCNLMGMTHNLGNLYYARQVILNFAKAFQLDAIDFVSVNLNDDELFLSELYNGFSMGFDAKFIIHPKQLNLMNGFMYFSDDEVKEAEEVYSQIQLIETNQVSVLKIGDKIFEKPHINRVKKIIKWKEQYGSK